MSTPLMALQFTPPLKLVLEPPTSLPSIYSISVSSEDWGWEGGKEVKAMREGREAWRARHARA